jgi:hypothetical protein
MKISTIAQEQKKFEGLEEATIKAVVLDCFLHHKLKLIRNWGSTDETDELCYKDVTLLQFGTKSCNFQIIIKPKESTISLLHITNRGRKLYLYFIRKLEAIRNRNYKPNF